MKPKDPSQSALFTRSAFPPPKSRKRSNCFLRAARFRSSVSGSRRFLSFDFPEGSPIMPVAPPITAIARCPARWKWARPMIGIRFPAWKEGPVGSNPM